MSKCCISETVFVWRPTLLLHIAVVKYNPQWCTMQPAIQLETQLHSCTQVSRQEVQQTTFYSHTFQSYQHQSTIAFQPVNILYCNCACVIFLFLCSYVNLYFCHRNLCNFNFVFAELVYILIRLCQLWIKDIKIR